MNIEQLNNIDTRRPQFFNGYCDIVDKLKYVILYLFEKEFGDVRIICSSYTPSRFLMQDVLNKIGLLTDACPYYDSNLRNHSY